MALVNSTAEFLGDASTWGQACLLLDDLHGLWGGRTITLDGNGDTIVRIFPVAQYEKRFEFTLGPDEVQRFFRLCIEHDLLSIRFPPRDSIRPDEVHPTITLMSGAGQSHSVTCWAGDPRNPHFEALYSALRQLEQRTHDMQPVYEGQSLS